MKRIIGVVLLVLVAGLWVASSNHAQGQVGSDDATAQAASTAVAKPVQSPTP